MLKLTIETDDAMVLAAHASIQMAHAHGMNISGICGEILGRMLVEMRRSEEAEPEKPADPLANIPTKPAKKRGRPKKNEESLERDPEVVSTSEPVAAESGDAPAAAAPEPAPTLEAINEQLEAIRAALVSAVAQKQGGNAEPYLAAREILSARGVSGVSQITDDLTPGIFQEFRTAGLIF